MNLLLLEHSLELIVLSVVCILAVSAHGYWHAKNYWEGLPPRVDALISAIGFAAMIGSFVLGGRLGSMCGHPNAVRLLAITVVVILYRAIRTWIGLRSGKSRPPR